MATQGSKTCDLLKSLNIRSFLSLAFNFYLLTWFVRSKLFLTKPYLMSIFCLMTLFWVSIFFLSDEKKLTFFSCSTLEGLTIGSSNFFTRLGDPCFFRTNFILSCGWSQLFCIGGKLFTYLGVCNVALLVGLRDLVRDGSLVLCLSVSKDVKN